VDVDDYFELVDRCFGIYGNGFRHLDLADDGSPARRGANWGLYGTVQASGALLTADCKSRRFFGFMALRWLIPRDL
jgi:hypothetical protein